MRRHKKEGSFMNFLCTNPKTTISCSTSHKTRLQNVIKKSPLFDVWTLLVKIIDKTFGIEETLTFTFHANQL